MSINSIHPGPTSGICVTSIIKDKIREYMMNDTDPIVVTKSSSIDICASEADADDEPQRNDNVLLLDERSGRRMRNKQDPVSTTGLGLPSTLDVSMHNSGEPCPHRQDLVAASVRRIGNSLDALLHESKRASQVRAIRKSSSLAGHHRHQRNADGLFISSDQIRYRKGAVTLHDICEEYIQFITVNSSADEQTVTTTSENESNDPQNATPELEIIPVNVGTITASSSSAGEKHIAQISVITINENLARNSASVIRKSVEEMHVTPENDCEKSRGENDPNPNKLDSEGNEDAQEELFPSVNGVKSAVSIEIHDKLAPLNDAAKENIEPEEGEENVEEKLANGVNHDANDDVEEEEEEEAVEDEEITSVDEKLPVIKSAMEEPSEVDDSTRMETDEVDTETAATTQLEDADDAAEVTQQEAPSPGCEASNIEPSSEEVSTVKNEPNTTSSATNDPILSTINTVNTTATTTSIPTSVPTIIPPVTSPAIKSPTTSTTVTPATTISTGTPVTTTLAITLPTATVSIISETTTTTTSLEVDPADYEMSVCEEEHEKKVESPEEKETVEAPALVVRVAESEKPVTNQEEVAPSASGDASVSANSDEVTTENKVAEKIETSNSTSEPVVEKKIAQITVKEPPKEVTITPAVGGTKRRVEVADEVEPDRDGGISSSCSGSGSETENTQDCKRIRFDESIFEEDERERLIREFVERSTDNSEEIGKNCDKLQHEIAALSDLARAKELEWNSIMRLLKLKEEMLERILFKKRHLDGHNNKDLSNLNKQFKNFVSSSLLLDSSNKSNVRSNENSSAATISNQVTVVPIGPSPSGGVASTAAAATASTNGGLFNALSPQPELISKSSNGSPAVTLDPLNKLRPHRPILPKPPPGTTLSTALSSQPHTSFLQQSAAAAQLSSSSSLSSNMTHPSLQSSAAGLTPNSLIIDQNLVVGEGRQGPTVDVKSIIAEFRSKNPDSLPRRGRRNLPFPNRIPDGAPGPRFLHNTALLNMANMAALQSASHVRAAASSTTHNDHRATNFMLGQDNAISASLSRSDLQQVRHPNIDSLMLTVNTSAGGGGASHNSSQQQSGGAGNVNHGTNAGIGSSSIANNCFQEALVKLSKMNEKRDMALNAVGMHKASSSTSSSSSSHLPPPPPYPEVTLHPVLAPQQSSGSPPVQNSLLHGILTKSSNSLNRGVAAGGGDHHQATSTMGGGGGGMGPSSVSSMQQHRPTTFSPTLARLLTTPDRNRTSRATISQSSRSTKSALCEILNSKKSRTEVTITPVTTSTPQTRTPSDVVLDEDDESEAADRLIIDEGRDVAADGTSNVIPADQVPECQGCHKKAAQFVCAGCGNQWYCSRECQVQAWEDHSEMCSG